MFRTILPLGAAVAALVATHLLKPALAGQDKPLTLLTMLSEWKYPGAELAGGASMSDGGNHEIQSVKCKAVLTTPDPIDKVIKFYTDRFEAPRDDAPRDADAKSVSDQDDSDGRSLTLRVIVVNKADTSTTLVISRAEGEKTTHIAWSHYVRLGEKR